MARQVPPVHAAFLARQREAWPGQDWLLGIAVGGSWVAGGLDAYSDLDLVVVHDGAEVAMTLAGRRAFAARLGDLLQAFTGEHVGEPRLLVCLYGPPLLHVDLKFVTLEELGTRVEDPEVLWERDGALTHRIAETRARRLEAPDLQWVEDRIWVWVHYIDAKIRRGELLEVLDGLAFLRGRVLGPLAQGVEGHENRGVRRVEQRAGRYLGALNDVVAGVRAADCHRALRAAVLLYDRLRAAHPDSKGLQRSPAEPPVRRLCLQ